MLFQFLKQEAPQLRAVVNSYCLYKAFVLYHTSPLQSRMTERGQYARVPMPSLSALNPYLSLMRLCVLSNVRYGRYTRSLLLLTAIFHPASCNKVVVINVWHILYSVPYTYTYIAEVAKDIEGLGIVVKIKILIFYGKKNYIWKLFLIKNRQICLLKQLNHEKGPSSSSNLKFLSWSFF